MVKDAGMESISEDPESEDSQSFSLTDALQRATKKPATAVQKRKNPQGGRKPPLKDHKPTERPPTQSRQSRYTLRKSTLSSHTSESQREAAGSESEEGSQAMAVMEQQRERSGSQQVVEEKLEEELSLWEWAEWTLKSLAKYFSLRPL